MHGAFLIVFWQEDSHPCVLLQKSSQRIRCSLEAFFFLFKGSKPLLLACPEGCQPSSAHTHVQMALTAECDHIPHSLIVNIKIFCQRFPFHSAIKGNKWNFWRYCKAESCISHFCQSFYSTQKWWQPTSTKDETPDFSLRSLSLCPKQQAVYQHFISFKILTAGYLQWIAYVNPHGPIPEIIFPDSNWLLQFPF